MPRVLLDTTYLLPVAGIHLQRVQKDTLKKAKSAGHQLFISEISLFELAAKGAKLAKNRLADRERLAQALQSLVLDESLGKVKVYDEEALSLAIDLRQHHSDFVDCLILASAISTCEVLLTEDELLTGNDELMAFVKKMKPTFSITTSKRLLASRGV
jgi:PIN domain nuclease of toxin-antitoxin system